MACTIDHLRSGYRVTILRDFKDLSGHGLRAGDTAIVREMGADATGLEFWIDLESAGSRRRYRFAIRSTEGPRLGRMKEYFEMGDSVEPIPQRASAPAPAPPPAPRPPPSFAQGTGGQLADNTPLGGLRVACHCDPAFHREVLPARSNLLVSACLSCGTVTCSRSFGDDGRFTGDAWQEFRTVQLPEAVHRWISGWPRVRIDHTASLRWPMSADLARYPTLYYPADARCRDLQELAALEDRLALEQAGQTPAQLLRSTHRVRKAPPSGMTEGFYGYVMLWEALQMGPRSSVKDLLHLAQPKSPGKDVAAELLSRRPDAFERIRQLLGSSEAGERGIGYEIARAQRPVDPRLPGFLLELMARLPFTPSPDVPMGLVSRSHFELILLLIADLRLATPEVEAALKDLMLRSARHDDFLTRMVRSVRQELAAPPPPAPPPASSAPRRANPFMKALLITGSILAMICTVLATVTAVVFCLGMGANSTDAQIRTLKLWMGGFTLLGITGIGSGIFLIRTGLLGWAIGASFAPVLILLVVFIIAMVTSG